MRAQDAPEIFGRHRPNLIKFYEILKAAETPLPRTRILQAANLGQQTNNSLFFWLLKQGFIEQLDYKDLGKTYLASLRKKTRNAKGWFRITVKGKSVLKVYEALFDIIGISDMDRTRFPTKREGVVTRPFSGQKIRV